MDFMRNFRAAAARPLIFVLMASLVLPPAAYAARPMITDDARITDAHACQVETWRRQNRGNYEFWALPACNPTGNLEITFGGNDTTDGGGGRANAFLLQGKTLFRTLETNGWSYGLAVGAIRQQDPAVHDGLTNAYFYVPVSASFLDDGVIVHMNGGGQSNHVAGTHPYTWGIGTELNFTRQFALIAETFAEHEVRRSYQGGVRFWVVPGRFQIDTTMGGREGSFGATRFWTIGLRLISPPFLR